MEAFDPQTLEALKPLARRYVWWKSAEEALATPAHALAHIMNLATFEDMQTLSTLTDEPTLSEALTTALPGWFSEKSWHFWHYRLNLAKPGQMPAMPVRKFS